MEKSTGEESSRAGELRPKKRAVGGDLAGNLPARTEPRRLVPADLADCLALSSEAGWNQTEADWAFMLNNGTAWGLADAKDRVVATVIGLAWPGCLWWAMVLVKQALRGQGLARDLLEAVGMGRAAKAPEMLDATSLGQPLYERRGFRNVETLSRMSGKAPVHAASKTEASRLDLLDPMERQTWWGREAAASGWGMRDSLLAYLAESYPEAALCLSGADGEAAVWCRPGRKATQVGPLIADHPSSAWRLLEAVLQRVSGPVLLDVPAGQQAFVACLKEHGFSEERVFERMVRGNAPGAGPGGWQRFASAGPDFG